jgi:hypothetical protein
MLSYGQIITSRFSSSQMITSKHIITANEKENIILPDDNVNVIIQSYDNVTIII